MDIFDCIKTRRSRRLFLNKKVPEDLIKKLLGSGLHAPSSRNCQPLHYIIVSKKEVKEKIAELKEDENRAHILTAPISIIVCVDLKKSPKRFVEDGGDCY